MINLKCKQAPITGHCEPEESYIEFKCVDGYDKEFGKLEKNENSETLSE